MRQLIAIVGALLLLPAGGALAQTAAQVCAIARQQGNEAFLREHCPASPAAHQPPSAAVRRAPQPVQQPVAARSPQPRMGEVFRDAPDAPEMVVIPPGAFTMGSPASEPGRYADESPQHRVSIGYSLAVGRYDVTREQYAAFVTATAYTGSGTGCDWRSPGFDQSGADPVVCVSWEDAQAYASWLSRKTGHTYRLLSEAEWEYAARAGELRRLRQPVGRKEDLACRQLCAQRLRSLRHGGRCLAVDRGLPRVRLFRRARRRLSEGRGRLCLARHSRRFLVHRSQGPSVGHPRPQCA
jgi:hypothetical protein